MSGVDFSGWTFLPFHVSAMVSPCENDVISVGDTSFCGSSVKRKMSQECLHVAWFRGTFPQTDAVPVPVETSCPAQVGILGFQRESPETQFLPHALKCGLSLSADRFRNCSYLRFRVLPRTGFGVFPAELMVIDAYGIPGLSNLPVGSSLTVTQKSL